MRARLCLLVAVAVSIVATAGEASAAGPPPVTFEYTAPSACPDRATVLRAITARAPSVRVATPGETARTLRISVAENAGAFAAGLEVIDLGGVAMHRELRGAECEPVVSAMALVAALALDPLAESTPAAPGDAVAGVLPALPIVAPPPPVIPPAPTWPVAEPAPAAVAPAPREEPAPQPVALPTNTHRAWHFGIGVSGEVEGLSALGAVVLPEAFAALGIDRRGPFSPSFRAGVIGGQEGTVTHGALSASFNWVAGKVDGCPVRALLLPPLALRPCIGVDVGSLSATTTGTTSGTNPTRLWVDVTLKGRVEWRAFSWLSFEADGGVMIPATRSTFVFEPDAQLGYQPPSVAGVGSLSAVVFFL